MAGGIDQLIVNGPYGEPERHWRYDRESRTFSLEAGRRLALDVEKKLLEAHRVVFSSGLNEDLGATAIFGSQVESGQEVPQMASPVTPAREEGYQPQEPVSPQALAKPPRGGSRIRPPAPPKK